MLDLIFVVESSEEWHTLNMTMNPTHYTSILPLNATYVAKVQVTFSLSCATLYSYMILK